MFFRCRKRVQEDQQIHHRRNKKSGAPDSPLFLGEKVANMAPSWVRRWSENQEKQIPKSINFSMCFKISVLLEFFLGFWMNNGVKVTTKMEANVGAKIDIANATPQKIILPASSARLPEDGNYGKASWYLDRCWAQGLPWGPRESIKIDLSLGPGLSHRAQGKSWI